jgi:Putative Ig domain
MSISKRLIGFGLIATLALCNLAQAATLAITGNQDLYTAVGTRYTYTPSVTGVTGTAKFSSMGNPSWLITDAKTGRLSGTAIAADVRKQFRIVIKVTDAVKSAELYVYLHITAAAAPANTAPTITGTPSQSATVGAAFSFVPVGKDANGDALAYSIVNKPSWASFSTATGAISGTPTAAGTFANIVISVSDGKAKTALPAFTLTVAAPVKKSAVTLSWKAPTSNEDFSNLTDLAGYRVMYGTSADKMTNKLEVPGATMTSVRLEELVSGTYFFAVKAYRKDGVESNLTETVWKTL